MRDFSCVVALYGQAAALGNGGKIPWRLPPDLAFFRKLTIGHSVIMGRKTWESLPCKPLQNRRNYVISRNLSDTDALCVRSLQEAIEDASNNIIVCGGAQVYEEAMRSEYCKHIFVTRILGDPIECDCFLQGARVILDENSTFGWKFEFEGFTGPLPHEEMLTILGFTVVKGMQTHNDLKYVFECYSKFI